MKHTMHTEAAPAGQVARCGRCGQAGAPYADTGAGRLLAMGNLYARPCAIDKSADNHAPSSDTDKRTP